MAVPTPSGIILMLRQRRKARDVVEEARSMSCHDHNEDVAQAMVGILECIRVSSDESEENKAVRVAYESLYSCWVEGCLPPPLLAKVCNDYLLNPARNVSANASQRICALMLGSLLSSAPTGACRHGRRAYRTGGISL